MASRSADPPGLRRRATKLSWIDLRPRDASRDAPTPPEVDEATRRVMCKAKAVEPTAMQEVGVFDECDQCEARLDPGCFSVFRDSSSPLAQGRQADPVDAGKSVCAASIRAPPARKRRWAALPWLCSSTGPPSMPSPHRRATTAPSGSSGSTNPPALAPAAAHSRPSPKIAPRCVLTRSRRQHGPLRFKTNDPQPPHAAAERALISHSLQIGPDSRSAASETCPHPCRRDCRCRRGSPARLRPGFELHDEAIGGDGADGGDIGRDPRSAQNLPFHAPCGRGDHDPIAPDMN